MHVDIEALRFEEAFVLGDDELLVHFDGKHLALERQFPGRKPAPEGTRGD